MDINGLQDHHLMGFMSEALSTSRELEITAGIFPLIEVFSGGH